MDQVPMVDGKTAITSTQESLILFILKRCPKVEIRSISANMEHGYHLFLGGHPIFPSYMKHLLSDVKNLEPGLCQIPMPDCLLGLIKLPHRG